jgi:hypothetical protein
MKIIISIVKLISRDKNDSKFNIFLIKGLKFMNCPKEFLMHLLQMWTNYLIMYLFLFDNLTEFPMTKNYSKFNISHTLSLKNFKSHALNPNHWRLSNNIKSTPKFRYNF